MIKSIEWQIPVKITIIKDGNVVADLYVPGINGYIDTDKVVVLTQVNEASGRTNIRLEV